MLQEEKEKKKKPKKTLEHQSAAVAILEIQLHSTVHFKFLTNVSARALSMTNPDYAKVKHYTSEIEIFESLALIGLQVFAGSQNLGIPGYGLTIQRRRILSRCECVTVCTISRNPKRIGDALYRHWV